MFKFSAEDIEKNSFSKKWEYTEVYLKPAPERFKLTTGSAIMCSGIASLNLFTDS